MQMENERFHFHVVIHMTVNWLQPDVTMVRYKFGNTVHYMWVIVFFCFISMYLFLRWTRHICKEMLIKVRLRRYNFHLTANLCLRADVSNQDCYQLLNRCLVDDSMKLWTIENKLKEPLLVANDLDNNFPMYASVWLVQ